MLHDLQGVICLVDDILVHGRTQEEHDQRLRAVPHRVRAAGLTRSKEKCEFSKKKIKFLGHVVRCDSRSRQDPGHTGNESTEYHNRVTTLPGYG